MLFCNKCGKQLAEDANFCNICGAKVVRQGLVCKKCGKKLPEESNFCNICGFPVNGNPEEVKPAAPEAPKTPEVKTYKSKLINPELPVVFEYDKKYEKTPFQELTEAAKTGDPAAIFELANRYKEGVGGAEKDPKKSAELFKEGLKKQNHVKVFTILGLLIEDDLIYGEDKRSEGIPYYEAAVELGDRHAASLLGLLYTDEEYVNKDDEKALMYFREAIRLGDGDSYFPIGQIYFNQRKYVEAKENFEKAMDYPDVKCYTAIKLGLIYEFGAEGVKADPVRALKLYELVYDNRDKYEAEAEDAMIGIARILFEKKTGKTDPVRTFNLLTEAEKKGDKRANFYLGNYYWKGIPDVINPDIPTAIKYLKDVNESIKPEALYCLGVIYYVNLHETIDAVSYLTEATNLGHVDAKKLLEKISKENKLSCRKCGAPIRFDSKFCGKCGTPVGNGNPITPPAPTQTPVIKTPAPVRPVSATPVATAAPEPPKIIVPASVQPASAAPAAPVSPEAPKLKVPEPLEPPKTTVQQPVEPPKTSAQQPLEMPKKSTPAPVAKKAEAEKPVDPKLAEALKMLAAVDEKANAGQLDEARELMAETYKSYPDTVKVIDYYTIFLANELVAAWENGTEGSDKTKENCELVFELTDKLRKSSSHLDHANMFESSAHCTLGRYYQANGNTDMAMQEWKKTDVLYEPYAAYHIYEVHKKMAKRTDSELRETYKISRDDFEKEHVSDVELLKKALNSAHFSNKQEKAWIYLALASHYTNGSTYITKDLEYAYECVQNASDLGSRKAVEEMSHFNRNDQGVLEYKV